MQMSSGDHMGNSPQNPNQSGRHSHSGDSVTEWLNQIQRASDPEAFAFLFERYLQQVTHMASHRLPARLKPIVDGDDIAAEVFVELNKGLQEGRFQQMQDRRDLWQVLIMLSERRAIAWQRRQQRQKRGGENVVGESAIAGDDSAAMPFSRFAGSEPSPEDATVLAETLRMFLQNLPNDQYRSIAADWLTGFTQQEISARTNVTLTTVERRIAYLRQRLDKMKAENQ
jgi:RNA polymerase sigma factor (sigma-70 family)